MVSEMNMNLINKNENDRNSMNGWREQQTERVCMQRESTQQPSSQQS